MVKCELAATATAKGEPTVSDIARRQNARPAGIALAAAGRVGIAALLAVYLVVANTVAAEAYADRDTTGLQIIRQNPPLSIGAVRASIHLADLRAGEVHELRADSAVGYSAPDRNFVGQKITCEDAAGKIVQEIWNGENLLIGAVEVPLVARMLFVAPVAGSYDCRLRVYAQTHTVNPATALLRSGSITDLTGDLGDVATVGRAPYVGPSFYFKKGTRTKSVQSVLNYNPPDGTRRLIVTGDVYVTVCYGAGGSTCPAGVVYPAGGEAFITHSLVAVPRNIGCPIVRSKPRTERLTSAVHHRRYLDTITVTLPAGLDCGPWRSTVLVSHSGGMSFVVHNLRYSTAYITPRA